MIRVILFIIISLFAITLYSQGCEDAGFESGSSGGYQGYIGMIATDGTVVIDQSANDADRHKIMHISDGYDPIAAVNCMNNYLLPVVAPGGGQYSMRLGNSEIEAEAERILLRFTVTPEISFFLLKYAVVLEDPNHEEFEQPRFEMRILDAQGNTFPCGEYIVRAAKDIPNFENCNDWRVRPWTTAGFELQSYLGQEIMIEILTTDCAKGGHAGYAYVDASCQPLEINLYGYCPGNTYAELLMTEGFETYLWSTGDSSSSIFVNNPQAGDIYSVTVTSATGCQISLSDTIPDFQSFSQPIFEPLNDTTICANTNVIIRPKGQNLGEVYCEELMFSAEEFLIKPDTSATYTFTTSDPFGCSFDTVQMRIDIVRQSIEVMGEHYYCNGDTTNIAVFFPSPNAEYYWEPGNIPGPNLNIPVTSDSVFTVYGIFGGGCTLKREVIIALRNPDTLTYQILPTQDTTICEGEAIAFSIIGEELGPVSWGDLSNDSTLIKSFEKSIDLELKIFDVSGCESVIENIKVQVIESPRLFIEDEICTDSILTVDVYQEHIDAYLWSDGSTAPSLEINDSGEFSISVSNACAAVEKTFKVNKIGEDCSIYVPNSFSPNDDFLNDSFKPFLACQIGELDEFSFLIFDRWGNQVYATNSTKDSGWNGKNYQPGVYVWILELKHEECNISTVQKGELVLFK